MNRHIAQAFAAGFALLAAAAVAQAPPPVAPAGATTTLETVVVSGEMPGPGLWRVERDGHELYVLGTVSPLSAEMDWVSTEVEGILDRADEVIAPGGAYAEVGASDTFKIALLAPSAIAAMKLPDGGRLVDVLPAPVHARWREMRAKYLPDRDKIERSRPMFASQDLYYAAIDAVGLTRDDVVWQRVRELAEARGIPVTATSVGFPLALDRRRYRDGIAALAESRIDDTTCFAQTLASLETDLNAMRAGANAWAVGDFETLLAPEVAGRVPACKPVYDTVLGFQARPERDAEARDAWFAAADAALRRNAVSFAVLPFAELEGDAGALARLRAAGGAVIAPFGANAVATAGGADAGE